MSSIGIRTVNVVQYLKPLREGGSLPAIVQADDGFLYVLKFRGAGQGKKALIAELLGGELARAIGLKVPELVFMNLDDSFSKTEPDEEIQDLLKFSVGLNLGLHFLSSAITFDPLVSQVDALTASKVVLLDSTLILSYLPDAVSEKNDRYDIAGYGYQTFCAIPTLDMIYSSNGGCIVNGVTSGRMEPELLTKPIIERYPGDVYRMGEFLKSDFVTKTE